MNGPIVVINMNNSDLLKRYKIAFDKHETETEKLELLERLFKMALPIEKVLENLILYRPIYSADAVSELEVLKLFCEELEAVVECKDYIYDKYHLLSDSEIHSVHDDVINTIIHMSNKMRAIGAILYVYWMGNTSQPETDLLLYLHCIKYMIKTVLYMLLNDGYQTIDHSTLDTLYAKLFNVPFDMPDIKLDEFIDEVKIQLIAIKDSVTDSTLLWRTLELMIPYIEILKERKCN